MNQYDVTGITFTIATGLPRAQAEEKANAFIMSIEPGTPLILMAEPTNPYDENAIAVYKDYTQHIGYIKSVSCLEVKELLDENGQYDAVVVGNDGRHKHPCPARIGRQRRQVCSRQ